MTNKSFSYTHLYISLELLELSSNLQPTFLQYIPYLVKSKRSIFDRFAVLFSVAIVWAYGEILTVAGAYDNRSPKTQMSCRTDRSGLVSAAPW